jgi:DNA-directed RNA polymerase specialized sigma subunit
MKGSIYPLATAIAKVMADGRERTRDEIAAKIGVPPKDILPTLKAMKADNILSSSHIYLADGHVLAWRLQKNHQWSEDQIGAAMLAMARKEGKRPGLPVVINHIHVTPITERRAAIVCDMLKAKGEVAFHEIKNALDVGDSQASYVITEVGKRLNLERDRSKGFTVYRVAKEDAA